MEEREGAADGQERRRENMRIAEGEGKRRSRRGGGGMEYDRTGSRKERKEEGV